MQIHLIMSLTCDTLFSFLISFTNGIIHVYIVQQWSDYRLDLPKNFTILYFLFIFFSLHSFCLRYSSSNNILNTLDLVSRTVSGKSSYKWFKVWQKLKPQALFKCYWMIWSPMIIIRQLSLTNTFVTIHW